MTDQQYQDAILDAYADGRVSKYATRVALRRLHLEPDYIEETLDTLDEELKKCSEK